MSVDRSTLGRALLLAAVCLLGSAAAAPAQPATAQPVTDDERRMPMAPLHEQVLNLPGDPLRPVTLEVTLFTPSGPGPFPLAVMNHGATDASGSNRGERYHYTVSAYYFLSRGYAVVLPMMRGFAKSGGSIVHAGCDLASVAEANAADIVAVTNEIERRPDIDRTRVVIAGQSFGAWNTLGVGTAPPPGTRAMILFNAALRTSDCPRQDEAMIEAAAKMGGQTRIPSLFLYGDNDSVMPNATWNAVYSRYSLAGGRADLFDFGRWGTDSHQLLSDPESLSAWAPRLDAFLARSGLPSRVVDPGYLPHAPIPATDFAALNDVAAVPYVNDVGRTAYRRFLGDKLPRAFVVASNGGVALFSGGYDPVGIALKSCARAGLACEPYAVDNAVVWSGKLAQTHAAGPLTVVKTVRAGVPDLIGAFFQLNPDCSPRGQTRLDVTSKPLHGAALVAPSATHPKFPAGSPLVACNDATVPATALTYTAAAGFAGQDAFDVTETTAAGKRRDIHLALTIVP